MAFSQRGLTFLLRSAVRALRGLSSAERSRGSTQRRGPVAGRQGQPSGGVAGRRGAEAGPDSPYPGDYRGTGTISYSPEADGAPDPGEIVWTWVPYEEDHTRGKDRPVLVIGYDRGRLLALMLTTRDRNKAGRRDGDYLDLGTGAWDVRGRPSEVKLDRVLQLEPDRVRREGAVLPRASFEQVARAMRGRGWS